MPAFSYSDFSSGEDWLMNADPLGTQAAQLEVRQAAGLEAGGLQDLPAWQAQRLGQLFQQAGPETTLGRSALPAWYPQHHMLRRCAARSTAVLHQPSDESRGGGVPGIQRTGPGLLFAGACCCTTSNSAVRAACTALHGRTRCA